MIKVSKIDYFKNINEGTKIYLEDDIKIYNRSSKYLANKILKENLTSIKAYNESLKQVLNYKYLNPYVLKNIILFNTGNINKYNTIWINYNNIKSVKKINNNVFEIVFYSNNKLQINKKITYFYNIKNKIYEIKRYLFNL